MSLENFIKSKQDSVNKGLEHFIKSKSDDKKDKDQKEEDRYKPTFLGNK